MRTCHRFFFFFTVKNTKIPFFVLFLFFCGFIQAYWYVPLHLVDDCAEGINGSDPSIGQSDLCCDGTHFRGKHHRLCVLAPLPVHEIRSHVHLVHNSDTVQILSFGNVVRGDDIGVHLVKGTLQLDGQVRGYDFGTGRPINAETLRSSEPQLIRGARTR